MPAKILGLYYTHEHMALRLANEVFCYSLQKEGHETELIDLASPDGPQRLNECLSGGNIAFAFGVQGIGSNLESQGVNVWTARRIPFVGLHFDSPCHNPFNHFSDSRYVGYVYFFKCFLEAKQRYLPSDQLSITVPFKALYWPLSDHPPWEQRPVRLLYLKSGGNVNEYTAYFDSLPTKIRNGVYQQLERVNQSPNFQLFDLVDEIFVAAGMDRKAAERSFWGLVQTMDYYLRHKRAIDMVEWLKFQDGALIVGNDWDFIDKTGARATFSPARNVYEANAFYDQTQFICNTTPYGSDIIHERAMTGLLCGSRVLSDTNAWWDSHFADAPGLTRFTYDQPFEEQLRPALESTDSTEAARASQARALKLFTEDATTHYLADFAEKVRVFAES